MEVRAREHGLGACGDCGAVGTQRQAVPDPATPEQGGQWLLAPVRLRDALAPVMLPAVPAGSISAGGAVFGL